LKSLLAADVEGPTPFYRLLDTTRAYALEKLTESGELQQIASRHAEYFRDLFVGAKAEWGMRSTAEWFAAYGNQIDNVRAALEWAFSPYGDAAIGMALTAASVPLWSQPSLVEECRERMRVRGPVSICAWGDSLCCAHDRLSEALRTPELQAAAGRMGSEGSQTPSARTGGNRF
jgi:hypothetical protein